METLAYLHLALVCDAALFPNDDPVSIPGEQAVRLWRQQYWYARASAGLLSFVYFLASVGVAGNVLAALKEGERGRAVKTLQQELKDAGYYDGPMTGYYGAQTEAAVRRFQQAQGLKVDGVVGSQTVSALDGEAVLEEAVESRQSPGDAEIQEANAARDRAPADPSAPFPALKRGKRGTAVEQLQQQLQQAGYYSGNIDGIYGSETEAAVEAFQQAQDLKIDGIAGSRTLTALSRAEVNSTEDAASAMESADEDEAGLPSAEADADATEAESGEPDALVLRRGDRGSQVKTLQQRLQALDYYTDEIDGIFGSDTHAAVRDFQRSQTLPVTGIANRETLAVLAKQVPAAMLAEMEEKTTATETQRDPQPAPARKSPLSQGDIGASVIDLQLQLRAVGFYNNGPVMGYFGTATTDALMEFQRTHGLTPTGIANPETQEVLRAATAPDRLQAVDAKTLSRGDRGPAVADLQKRLRQLGYYMAAINGRYNDATQDALKGFQIEKKLPATGVADRQTLDALGIQIGQLNTPPSPSNAVASSPQPARSTGTALSTDDRGEAVADLQRRLQATDYYNGPADGIYGPETEAAVKAFQQAQGLKPDGVAGQQTLTALLASDPEDN